MKALADPHQDLSLTLGTHMVGGENDPYKLSSDNVHMHTHTLNKYTRVKRVLKPLLS